MSSQAFFWINILLGVSFVALFLVGKKGFLRPSKLNLKADGDHLYRDGNKLQRATHVRSPESYESEGKRKEKPLNVLFMYNGHSWDAHEVLGIPAGAKLEDVKRAYNLGIQRAQPDSRKFLEAAFQAIQQSN